MPSGGGGGTYDEVFGNIPPESTTFGWPLYITVPYSFTIENLRIYEKEASDIGRQLYDWLQENNECEESIFVKTYYSYPPELYINGELITTVFWDESFGEVGDPAFYTSLISDGCIHSDGLIILNILYETIH